MLCIDSRAGYGRLGRNEFAVQDEIQVLKIIYAATCATNDAAADLKARLMSDAKDTVRLLSDIHKSDLDPRPHITLLYTQPTNQQQIIHIVAKFNKTTTRWEYQETGTARETRLSRTIKNAKDVRWSSIEMVANL